MHKITCLITRITLDHNTVHINSSYITIISHRLKIKKIENVKFRRLQKTDFFVIDEKSEKRSIIKSL